MRWKNSTKVAVDTSNEFFVNHFPPVRKIGIQTRSVTGTMPGGQRYESSLERDLMELVRDDPDFVSYHPQPVRIDYVGATGEAKSYTPDALIVWKSGRRPLLVEVKHRGDCCGIWRELIQKFRAARAHARECGWDFAVLTEDRIRGPRLENVRFLHAYVRVLGSPAVEQAILLAIEEGHVTPKAVLEHLHSKGHEKASTLPSLWHLIATHAVQIDWTRKLGMTVELRLGA